MLKRKIEVRVTKDNDRNAPVNSDDTFCDNLSLAEVVAHDLIKKITWSAAGLMAVDTVRRVAIAIVEKK